MEPPAQSRLALRLAGSSILLGIAGDLILGTDAWGVSLPLFAAFLGGQVLLLDRGADRKPSATSHILLGAAFVFSLCFLWRDSAELKFLNGAAVFALVGLAALYSGPKKLNSASLADVGVNALGIWAVFVGEFFMLFGKDIKWAAALKERGLAGTAAVGRGILIATPLLILFGALLISADASFQHLFDGLGNIDADAAWNHFFVIASCAVLTGGLLRHLFLYQKAPPKPEPVLPYVLAPSYHSAYRSPEPFRLGGIELAIVLGSLNLLFGAFVLVQIPYLFGGQSHVAATPHLGWGEYAHRGFFELVAVVGLAIPILLGSHTLAKKEAAGLWRGLSVVMVALLFVVMQSAGDRMRLYVGFYSLTAERLYVLAALGWMALTLLWFLASTVRNRPERFAFGSFAALLGSILVMNALNPDAVIAAVNLQKPPAKIDGEYLRTLSADARPALLRYETKLSPEVKQELEQDWRKENRGSWRSWNWGRYSAFVATQARTRVAER